MLDRLRPSISAASSFAAAGFVTIAFQCPAHAQSDPEIDALARDLGRVESVRAVKDLQRSYAQFVQFGLWDEAADLFAEEADFIWGDETVEGRAAIEAWLAARAGGEAGLAPGALNTEVIDEPLVNLSVDGETAKGRWMSLAFLGDGQGAASIVGGLYENEYVRDDGVWRIATSHFHPQYAGSYEEGWSNWRGEDLPIIPYHFTLEETGIPIPPAEGPAPASSASLDELEARINALNDEDDVRNLQNAYGYYVDQKMWDDVVDLFAENSVVEIAGVGVFDGPEGARRVMESMGEAGLSYGQVNEHPLFDTMVRVSPGGREAFSRGIEIAMVGDANDKTAHWEFTVFRNRFVKEDGLWKLKEMRLYPLIMADYFVGWGEGSTPIASASSPQPDAPVTESLPARWVPAFIEDHPVTGEPVGSAGAEVLGAAPLLDAIAPETASSAGEITDARLAEARRRLARSAAYDGSVNVSSAYGYYIDDFNWPGMGGLIAEDGNKQSPGAGYYFGKARVEGAATSMYGSAAPSGARAGIAFHWRFQPVINVAADGRSANVRTRLLQPGTGKEPGRSGFASGMYPNEQTVLEDGVWKLWSVTIDEHYFTSSGWKGGWASVEPREGGPARPSPLMERYPPDIALSELGVREEGFRAGTGEQVEWPGILPMWFNYKNPVSGREPERYWPDCVPCEMRPDVSMTAYGYLMPPTGPEPD